MDSLWGAGNPTASLPSNPHFLAFDNHRYLKYDSSVAATQSSYLSTSCSDNVASDGETPLIVGEWSISPATSAQSNSQFEISDSNNKAFYTKWWAAQVMTYEKQFGWIFWCVLLAGAPTFAPTRPPTLSILLRDILVRNEFGELG